MCQTGKHPHDIQVSVSAQAGLSQYSRSLQEVLVVCATAMVDHPAVRVYVRVVRRIKADPEQELLLSSLGLIQHPNDITS